MKGGLALLCGPPQQRPARLSLCLPVRSPLAFLTDIGLMSPLSPGGSQRHSLVPWGPAGADQGLQGVGPA